MHLLEKWVCAWWVEWRIMNEALDCSTSPFIFLSVFNMNIHYCASVTNPIGCLLCQSPGKSNPMPTVSSSHTSQMNWSFGVRPWTCAYAQSQYVFILQYLCILMNKHQKPLTFFPFLPLPIQGHRGLQLFLLVIDWKDPSWVSSWFNSIPDFLSL